MDAGVVSSPAPDAVLRDARLLNSDIGRHSVRCNFSTRLAGRFYQNGSLERHSARKSRLVEMQAKKRRLERELQLEEQRVKLLEDRLNETERAREDAQEMVFKIERGVVRLQSFVRRNQALRRYRAMLHAAHMWEFAARFLQRRYRGWKGRLRADTQRQYLRKKRRHESAAYIQACVRRRTQRRTYLALLSEKKRLRNRSATTIQAAMRGEAARQWYLDEIQRRQHAAMTAQRVWRGRWGRLEMERLRQELLRRRMEAEKPKRIPLHMRKYSTYGGSQRKPNNPSTKKRDARMRRRSSDAMIGMTAGQLSTLSKFHQSSASCSVGDRDENDSIASTTTSLSTSRRTNPPSWPSPKRVLNTRRHTTLQPCDKAGSRRGSLERRKTISGGLAAQLHCQRPPRDRQPTLETCSDSESEESDRSAPEAQDTERASNIEAEAVRPRDETDPASHQREEGNLPPVREIATPITVSKEASLIFQDILEKSITKHNIVHSTFDDELGEGEDDLG